MSISRWTKAFYPLLFTLLNLSVYYYIFLYIIAAHAWRSQFRNTKTRTIEEEFKKYLFRNYDFKIFEIISLISHSKTEILYYFQLFLLSFFTWNKILYLHDKVKNHSLPYQFAFLKESAESHWSDGAEFIAVASQTTKIFSQTQFQRRVTSKWNFFAP